MKKFVFISCLFIIFFCSGKSVAAYSYSRNFTTSLTSITDAYADLEVIEKAKEVWKIDRDWCNYFVDNKVNLGEKIAVLVTMLNNSNSNQDYEYSGEYYGSYNYTFFNAFLLAKYNLPKPDYAKMTVEDALIHLLFSHGQDEENAADTTQMELLRQRAPKSLALAVLSVVMKDFFNNLYYYDDYPRIKNIQNRKAALEIQNNYNNYKDDMRLSAAEILLNDISSVSPCGNDILSTDFIICHCQADEEGNPFTWEQKTACVETMQRQVLDSLRKEFEGEVENMNDDIAAVAKNVIESIFQWLDAERAYISTLSYEDPRETRIKRLLWNQQAFQHATFRYKTYNFNYMSTYPSDFLSLITYYYPEDLKKKTSCHDFEDLSDKQKNVCMDFFDKEINRLYDQTVKGIKSDPSFEKAKNAWFVMFENNKQLFKLQNDGYYDEYQFFNQLIMQTDRIGLWNLYMNHSLSKTPWVYDQAFYQFLSK